MHEINVAVDWKLLELKEVMDLVKSKPETMEIVLTGRYAHPDLIELADQVSEVKEVKHPFQKGVMARKGIEF